MFLTWQTIEWKSCDKSLYDYEALDEENHEDEEIPITEQIKTPPPPPPPAVSVVVEIVEDEEDVEEIVIEYTETDEEEIIEGEDVKIEEEYDDEDVPIAVILDAPIFPCCEKVKKSKNHAYFQ